MCRNTIIITIFFIINSSNLFSQIEDENDKIYGEKYHFSDILMNKSFNEISKNKLLPIKNIVYSECKPEYNFKDTVEITNIENNKLLINGYLEDNCGRLNSKFKVELVNDSTINILHASEGFSQRCFCYFRFELTLNLSDGISNFEKIRYIQLNDDNRTLKR